MIWTPDAPETTLRTPPARRGGHTGLLAFASPAVPKQLPRRVRVARLGWAASAVGPVLPSDGHRNVDGNGVPPGCGPAGDLRVVLGNGQMPCRVQPGECDPQPMRCAGVLLRHPPGSLEERGGPGWCAGPGGVESAQAAGQCRNGVERDGPQPVDGGWPGACSHIPAEQPLPVGML